MGCDIHMFAEKIDGRNGKWKKFGDVFPNPYYRKGEENKYFEDEEESWWSNPKKCSSPFQGRNYDLFAMLANVRNGRGFAGCDTGNGFIPIAMPKGLPKDVSPEIKQESDRWNGDGHSHSYFTVQELIDYDWDMVTTNRGWVSMDDFIIFKAIGKPSSWSGGVSGGAIKHVDEKEMIRAIKEKINPPTRKKIKADLIAIKDSYQLLSAYRRAMIEQYHLSGDILSGGSVPAYYTQVEWVEPYRDCAPKFIETTIPTLQKLGEADKVRIVFWFDN